MMKGQIAGLMKRTQQMQENVKKAQEQFVLIEAEGVSDVDLVKVVMACKNDMKRMSIDPNLLTEGGDKDLFEDLITAAFNDVVYKAEAITQGRMGSLISGLGGMASMLPPGFELPF